MISINLTSPDLVLLKSITRLLIKENLILKSHISEGVIRIDANGESTQFLCTFQTKALLYSKVEDIITSKYGEETPEIYSIPIVNMNWDQTNKIQQKIKAN